MKEPRRRCNSSMRIRPTFSRDTLCYSRLTIGKCVLPNSMSRRLRKFSTSITSATPMARPWFTSSRPRRTRVTSHFRKVRIRLSEVRPMLGLPPIIWKSVIIAPIGWTRVRWCSRHRRACSKAISRTKHFSLASNRVSTSKSCTRRTWVSSLILILATRNPWPAPTLEVDSTTIRVSRCPRRSRVLLRIKMWLISILGSTSSQWQTCRPQDSLKPAQTLGHPPVRKCRTISSPPPRNLRLNSARKVDPSSTLVLVLRPHRHKVWREHS